MGSILRFQLDFKPPDAPRLDFEPPDAPGLDVIDTLEGNGHFYQRRLDDFIELDSPKEHTAWVYFIMRDVDGEPLKSF